LVVIDLYSIFSEEEKATLSKLGIEITNKKYTEYEYELIQRKRCYTRRI